MCRRRKACIYVYELSLSLWKGDPERVCIVIFSVHVIIVFMEESIERWGLTAI